MEDKMLSKKLLTLTKIVDPDKVQATIKQVKASAGLQIMVLQDIASGRFPSKDYEIEEQGETHIVIKQGESASIITFDWLEGMR